MNEQLAFIWKYGYDVKITNKVVRVYSTEYLEYLDLDQYNTIVQIEHNGDVQSAFNNALVNAVELLKAKYQ